MKNLSLPAMCLVGFVAIAVFGRVFFLPGEGNPGKQIQQSETSLAVLLTNKNKPPEIIGEDPNNEVVFGRDYDWNENSRVVRVVDELCREAPWKLDDLLKHSSSIDYCLTIDSDMSRYCLTVGAVCKIIMYELACKPYEDCIALFEESVLYREMRSLKSFRIDLDDRIDDTFDEWLERKVKSGSSAAEIQADLCQIAHDECVSNKRIPDELRLKVCSSLKAKRDGLVNTGIPIPLKTIWSKDIYFAIQSDPARDNEPQSSE
jgi:hypothetical protein